MWTDSVKTVSHLPLVKTSRRPLPQGAHCCLLLWHQIILLIPQASFPCSHRSHRSSLHCKASRGSTFICLFNELPFYTYTVIWDLWAKKQTISLQVLDRIGTMVTLLTGPLATLDANAFCVVCANFKNVCSVSFTRIYFLLEGNAIRYKQLLDNINSLCIQMRLFYIT